MNGYQLARAVREIDQLPKITLVALTGYARESDRQAAAEAGFDAHLVKPLNPVKLYELIAEKHVAHEVS
jgi:CheY-like chemotaxis protein